MVQGSTALVEYAGETTTGALRTYNEDAFGAFEKGDVFIVADGFGGRLRAASAASEAVACFDPEEPGLDEVPPGASAHGQASHATDPLVSATLRANLKILRAGERYEARRGQGSALAAVRVAKGWLSIAHVGTCRVGRQRFGKLQWLTQDHTLASELRKNGASPEKIAELSVNANVIVRALGLSEQLDVEFSRVANPGDSLIILCTDGLTSQVDDTQIKSILGQTAQGLAERCKSLLDAAEAAGGADNATVVLLRTRA